MPGIPNWKAQGAKEGTCQKCNGPVSRFRADIALTCPACKKAAQQERSRQCYQRNLEKIIARRKERAGVLAANRKAKYAANRDAMLQRSREYHARDDTRARRIKRDSERADELRKAKAEWHKAHLRTEEDKKRWNEWRIRTGWSMKRHKERMASDPAYRIKYSLRNRIRMAIRGKAKVGSAVKLLGCTGEEAAAHIESQFRDGMTWDNWGRCGWSLDHIRPLASFNLEDADQLAAACHYTNLQPLWALDNIRKADKWVA